MPAQRHAVRRQTFELSVRDEPTARRMHEVLSRIQASSMAAIIERCCSMAGSPDRVDRIAHLDVDLGRLDPGRFEADIVARLSERLPGALATELAAAGTDGRGRAGVGLVDRDVDDSSTAVRPGASTVSRSAPRTRSAADPRASAASGPGSSEASAVVSRPEPTDRDVSGSATTAAVDLGGLETLAHFMRTGTLPWWVDPLQPDPLPSAVRRAVVSSPAALEALVAEVIDTPARLTRLVQALDDATLAALVGALAPEVAARVDVLQLTAPLMADHVTGVRTPRRRRTRVWASVVESVLADGDHNVPAVVAHSLGRLGRAIGVDRRVLADEALRAARAVASPAVVVDAFERALRGSTREPAAAPAVEATAPAADDSIAPERRPPDALPARPSDDRGATVTTEDGYGRAGPEGTDVAGVARAHGADTPDVLPGADTSLTPEVVPGADSSLTPLTPEHMPRADSSLTPEHMPRADSSLTPLTPEHMPGTDSSLTPLTPEHMPGADSSLMPDAGRLGDAPPMPTGASESAITTDRPAVRDDGRTDDARPPAPDQADRARSHEARTSRRSRTGLDLSFSDSDRVEVHSAGLVLLAPFIPTLFDRLGLVEHGRFVSDEARHRAVALLHHLATGQAEPAEYMAVLDKVLCGANVADVLEIGEPVTDIEREECSDLLTAVIEHAGVFGDLSPEGLRGTFLLRRGILAAEDGIWMLRVEREAYDVVLDRLPWDFEWLSLPWMSAPMRIEW